MIHDWERKEYKQLVTNVGFTVDRLGDQQDGDGNHKDVGLVVVVTRIDHDHYLVLMNSDFREDKKSRRHMAILKLEWYHKESDQRFSQYVAVEI